jgi:predicted nucleotidyltransferase
MTSDTRRPLPHDLPALAEIIADWIDDAPGFKRIYLFGSRVRGDDRQDSDVDLRIFMREFEGDQPSTDWWCEQVDSDFGDINRRLPGRLAIHRYEPEVFIDPHIWDTSKHVLTVRKVICVWTPRSAADRAHARVRDCSNTPGASGY